MKGLKNKNTILWALGCSLFLSVEELFLWILCKAGLSTVTLLWFFVISLLPIAIYIWRTKFNKPFCFVAVKVTASVVFFCAFSAFRLVPHLIEILSLTPLDEADNTLGLITVFFWELHISVDILLLLAGGIQKIRNRKIH